MTSSKGVHKRTGDEKGTWVSAEEAARLAGIKYVQEASYKEGAEEGWADGWRAGWAAALRLQDSTSEATGFEQVGETGYSANGMTNRETEHGEEGEEGEEGIHVELNMEWAKLFAKGEKQREERKKRHERHDSASDVGMENAHDQVKLCELDLGGLGRKKRIAQMKELYPQDRVSHLSRLETELDARFQAAVSAVGSSRWPFI